jgi:hypothetical protein
MKHLSPLIPLTLLLLLLTAGCASGGAATVQAVEPDPVPGASAPAAAQSDPAQAPTSDVDLAETPDDDAVETSDQAPDGDTAPEPEPYDYAAPVPESAPVEDSWFADAVFIGDSRTDGLRLYSGIRDVDFLCYKGLTVFELMDDKAVIDSGAGKVSVFQALGEKQYAKVYLMLGINELGYYNDQGFADAYGAAVDRVRQLQPNAQIYLQSIVPVNQETCQATGQPSYITNEQIAVYNGLIEAVAQARQVYYVNVAQALVDESGALPADASADGIHFHREGYQAWYAYLKTHTVEET